MAEKKQELILQNYGISIKVLEVANNRIGKIELMILNNENND